MTLVPDLSGFYKRASNSLYLHPGNDFSGMIFFSELDGDPGGNPDPQPETQRIKRAKALFNTPRNMTWEQLGVLLDKIFAC